MGREHAIVSQVYEAKKDSAAADALIRQYLSFIKSETAKFIGRPPVEGQDDALSVAMLAFYETILTYDKSRGAFLALAALAIRSRLIDFARAEKRQSCAVSYDGLIGENTSVGDTLADKNDAVEAATDRLSAQIEIEEFSRRLGEFGLTFSDVAHNCPRQARTMAACMDALGCAKKNPALLAELQQTKKLPIASLADGSGVSRKTLERHRKYLVAILLAYTNGYEIIRGHLQQVKGGSR